MEINCVVPYLSRMNTCQGTREKPEILYVTKGGKENSLIFHFKENGKFYRYRAKVVNKKTIILMCIYKRNSRSNDCQAFITISPNHEGLIILRTTVGKSKARFFINFDQKIDENSFSDWSVKSSNNKNHSSFCMEQVPFHMREFSQYIA